MAATIVFDLDGTLVDTAPDLIDTLNVIFARQSLPQLAFCEARPLIGGGVKPLIERALRTQGLSFTPEDVNRLFAEYLDHYVAHIADRSRPFPGAIKALDWLEARGCRLAICTNKLERLSVRLLEELKLSRRFAAICGQDTFGIPKPDPEILRRTIAKAGGDPARALMVGDSVTDIDTARAAGVGVVVVGFGYVSNPATLAAADRIIDHFDDLPKAVAEILPPRFA